MKNVHWGTLVVGIAIGYLVIPAAIGAVRGMGAKKAAAPAG